jgi:hypothetical protein
MSLAGSAQAGRSRLADATWHWRAAFAVLMCLPFIFLFARLPPPQQVEPPCMTTVTIGSAAHFTHVCDSFSKADEMANLDHYFTAYNPWRARPVYILGGAFLAVALSPAARLIRTTLLDGRMGGTVDPNAVLRRFPAYLAMMAINFLLLGLALWMALPLIGPQDRWLAFALGAAIVTGDMIHGMFWTQHSDFMNFLIPTGGIFYFLAGCRVRQMRLSGVVGFGLGATLAILTYTYAVIWLPAFVLGALYRDLRMGFTRAALVELVPRLLIFAAAGCLPLLAWIAFNALYLNLSVAYQVDTERQFMWVYDAWAAGRLGAALAAHWTQWNGYPSMVWEWLGWPAPVILAAAAALLAAGWRKLRAARVVLDPILVAAAVTIVCMLAFNFLQGAYLPRLTGGILLALFVAFARVAQLTGRPAWGAAALLAVSAGQVVTAFLWPAMALA